MSALTRTPRHTASSGVDSAARASGIVGLLGIAAVHLADLPGKLDETPYVGVLYVVGPIAGCLVAAAFLLRPASHAFGWALGGGIALATALGYVLSRTTGLPSATDDIGNWFEPLGVASLVLAAMVVALAARALAGRFPQQRESRQELA